MAQELDGYSIKASGRVTLTMIVNLKRFVRREEGVYKNTEDANTRAFEAARGTPEFADYLAGIVRDEHGAKHPRVGGLPRHIEATYAAGTQPFYLDTAEDTLLQDAHEMRVFRGYVLNQYFLPAYRLDKARFDTWADSPFRDDDLVLKSTFDHWDHQIMLTRNSFAVVRICRRFEDMPLAAIATEIQKMERSRAQDIHYPEARSNWRIAMDVTASLVHAIGGQFAFVEERGSTVTIPLDPEQRKGTLPLHDRFTTIHLDYVHQDGHTIEPDEFVDEYGTFALGIMRLATVLRGGAARDMRRRRPITGKELFNLSPWVSDLCLATNDAMLVYTKPAEDLHKLETLSGYSRSDYWRGVARGVEWLVNLKTEWQLIERQSTEMLSSIAGLTTRVNDGLLDDDDQHRLHRLALGVSEALNLLPELRYALVPSSITNATDVVFTYTHMLEQLGVYRIADHVTTNIEELSSFLSYYSSTQLQYEGRAQEETESRTGLTISIMLILLSLVSVPSLIKDFSEIQWKLVLAGPPLQLLLVVALSALPVLLLIITAWYASRRSA